MPTERNIEKARYIAIETIRNPKVSFAEANHIKRLIAQALDDAEAPLKAQLETWVGVDEKFREQVVSLEQERDAPVEALREVVYEYRALRMDLAMETTLTLEKASDALLAKYPTEGDE